MNIEINKINLINNEKYCVLLYVDDFKNNLNFIDNNKMIIDDILIEYLSNNTFRFFIKSFKDIENFILKILEYINIDLSDSNKELIDNKINFYDDLFFYNDFSFNPIYNGIIFEKNEEGKYIMKKEKSIQNISSEKIQKLFELSNIFYKDLDISNLSDSERDYLTSIFDKNNDISN